MAWRGDTRNTNPPENEIALVDRLAALMLSQTCWSVESGSALRYFGRQVSSNGKPRKKISPSIPTYGLLKYVPAAPITMLDEISRVRSRVSYWGARVELQVASVHRGCAPICHRLWPVDAPPNNVRVIVGSGPVWAGATAGRQSTTAQQANRSRRINPPGVGGGRSRDNGPSRRECRRPRPAPAPPRPRRRAAAR